MEELSPKLQALDLSFKREVKASEQYQAGDARHGAQFVAMLPSLGHSLLCCSFIVTVVLAAITKRDSCRH